MAFTKMQEYAVNGDFGNCLVSASAGSGKTFVMVSRVIRLVLQKKAGVNEILCVTFTELAARELKQRLSDEINKKAQLSEGAERDYLLEQIQLLPTANVSTIHAFCKNLLKEFFYEANIDPSFKIIDANESEMLANRAIDRLFEDLYEAADENLALILPFYFKKRSDSFLKRAVLSCYETLISEADYEGILNAGGYYYTEQGVLDCIKRVSEDFKNRAALLKMGAVKTADRLGEGKVRDFALSLCALLDDLMGCADIYEMRAFLGGVKLTKPSLSKNASEVQKQEDEILVSFYKNDFEKFKKGLLEFEIDDKDAEIERAKELAPRYNAFCYLVKKYSEYYAEEKRNENALDFSDLEHFTLKILKNDAVREDVRGRFKCVFTDEYQDTSGVQEAILSAIANNNMFMVGDLKQSIYNFRGCNPDIFAKKYKSFSNGEGGTAINLDVNFRSSNPVLKAVNNLFSSVMTEQFGSVDYGRSPMQFGGGYEDGEGLVNMFVVPKNAKEGLRPEGVYSLVKHVDILEQGKGFAEGKMIAELISKLINQEYFDVKSGKRKMLDYGDIAILLRNANSKADRYATELIRAGIPVSANTKNSIAEYAEVQFAVNLLRLIDGFNNDIPLVSTLKSPVGGLDEGELLKIRQFHKEGSFFDAYYAYMLGGRDELSEKLCAFDEYIKRIQMLAEFLPCDEILTTVVREKGVDSYLLCSKMGEIKLERLNRFILASSQKKQTVQEFLCGIDKTLESITINYTESNSVQIMSIHASKGLEFPIVILAGVGGMYSIEDLKGEFITDKEFGVALEHKCLESMTKRGTVFRSYLKSLKKKRLQEEELRLLYVAMTRAKNQLYITTEYDGNTIPPKREHGVCDGLYANSFCQLLARSDFEVCEIDGKNFSQLEKTQAKQVMVGDASEDLVLAIKDNIEFKYARAVDVSLPVKCSVTQTLKEEGDQTEYEYAPIFGDSSEEKGTAYHHFLELCDFEKEAGPQLCEFLQNGKLSEDEGRLIDEARLATILKMPIFKEVLGYTLYREQPFTMLVPATLIRSDYVGDERVLVQGVIDLLAVKDGRAIIVDYKFTTLKTDEQLVKKYEKQLKLYAYAVQNLLNVKIEALYIANIYSARLVKVDN